MENRGPLVCSVSQGLQPQLLTLYRGGVSGRLNCDASFVLKLEFGKPRYAGVSSENRRFFRGSTAIPSAALIFSPKTTMQPWQLGRNQFPPPAKQHQPSVCRQTYKNRRGLLLGKILNTPTGTHIAMHRQPQLGSPAYTDLHVSRHPRA